MNLPSIEPHPPVIGALVRHANFPTNLVDPRHIDVWLPPDYGENQYQRYAVLYMHDGQNLFDPDIAFTGIDWGIDEALVQLSEINKIRPAIVVGVWNVEKRWLDYIPQKPLETPQGQALREQTIEKYGVRAGQEIYTDRYLRFLVDELKPFIDDNYFTLSDRQNTFIMGSSMGGLASLYALCEYPRVFGGAGCLSTHWPALEELGTQWVQKTLPDAGQHKIYFDYGTETLDAAYEPYQQQIDAVIRAKGYTQNVNWLTRKFPGAEHNEAAWRQRIHIPLEFLLR